MSCRALTVALPVDVAQLSCQLQRGKRATGAVTLDPQLWRTLDQTCRVIKVSSESALEHLVDLRTAVSVPVPDLLAERYLTKPRRRIVHRQPSSTPLCFSAAASQA